MLLSLGTLAWECLGHRGNQLGGSLKKFFSELSLTMNWILPISDKWLAGRSHGHCSLKLTRCLRSRASLQSSLDGAVHPASSLALDITLGPDPPALHAASTHSPQWWSLSFLSLALQQSGVWALTKPSSWLSQPLPLPACLDKTAQEHPGASTPS